MHIVIGAIGKKCLFIVQQTKICGNESYKSTVWASPLTAYPTFTIACDKVAGGRVFPVCDAEAEFQCRRHTKKGKATTEIEV